MKNTLPSAPTRSTGLKPLKGWQAMVYPPVLACVGIFTWLKDGFFSSWPRRTYGPFVFNNAMFGNWILNQPVRVLVVDDDHFHQEVSHRLLERNGMIADFASNGREAVEACRKNHYDLVLMDIYMPGISGLEAADEIRRESASQSIRIVAVTGKLPVDREQLKLSGVDGFMRKPLVSSELQKHIRVSSAMRSRVS